MPLSYPNLRSWLQGHGLWPEGRVARLAWYLLGLAGGLFVLEKLLGALKLSWGEGLDGWVRFLLFVALVLFGFLSFRWLKAKILWRLRNRLIVTYVFIGVIPVVLLLAMAAITNYLFAGQFASYVVSSRMQAQLDSARAVNAAIASELAARLERGEEPTAGSLEGLRKRNPAWQRRQVCAWYGDKPLPQCQGPQDAGALTLPSFPLENFHEVVRDQGRLYLRVAAVLPVGAQKLTAITSEPFDQDLVQPIAADLGEITLYASGLAQNEPARPQAATPSPAVGGGKGTGTEKQTFVVRAGNETVTVSSDQEIVPRFTVGSIPAPAGSLDREVPFPTPLTIVDWQTGKHEQIGALLVLTRFSVLYAHLFAALGEYTRVAEDVLIVIAVFFAAIELLALFTGTRMTRTVTAAVAQLYEATRHVDRGDFSHRIPVKASDQLAQLGHAFNTMTASIEKLIVEQKEKQRLENELAIAQEVQAQLFPREATQLESLEVHGFCRPARTVSGDYYDFLAASADKLILAVGDISGKGISAALLMATIHSAVRAYSMEGLPQMREPVAVGAVGGTGRLMATWPQGTEVSPAALLALLNHQLYESTPPEKYATLFLGIYDGQSHRLTYSNGGHLAPILIGEHGSLRRLEVGGTVVGLFDNLTYEEASVEMQPGEIFLAYSDGVTEPENDFGEFGEERLIDLVRENRRLPLAQISQAVTLAVDDWIGDKEQPDDVTLVLARVR